MFKNAYPKVQIEAVNQLLSNFTDAKGEVSLALMQQFFNKHSKNNSNEAGKLLSFVANMMYNVNSTGGKQTDPAAVIETAFTSYMN